MSLSTSGKQQEENKTQKDTQTGKTVTVGSTISTKIAVYKVTKVNKTTGTVEYKKLANKKAKTIAIPDMVKVNGITYKVTGIAKNQKLKNRNSKNRSFETENSKLRFFKWK